jgi:hypothetical protein
LRSINRHKIISSLHFDEIVKPLFQDSVRSVNIGDLIVPRRAASFKLADILAIEKRLKNGEIDDVLTVNPDLMITKGLKRYYAMKRIGYTRVQIQVERESPNDSSSPFTILN